ncbi:MAG: CHAT domain-containing protein [Myxococcales bacterium]|nr:CHAT domain-containing protein [Myxococcales bacterium]
MPASGSDTAPTAAREAAAILRLAQAELARGDTQAAAARLSAALEDAAADDEPSRVAALQVALGAAELARGRGEEAQHWLQAGATAARSLGDAELEATALNDLGTLYALRGEGDLALEAFEASAARAEESGAAPLHVTARVNAARASGSPSDWAQAVAAARALPISTTRALALLGLAEPPMAGTGGDPADARQRQLDVATLLHEALETANALADDRTASYALGALGGVYASDGQPDAALELTWRAVRRAAQADAPESLVRWYAQAGQLQASQGHSDEAIESYQRAVDQLTSLRHRTRWGGRLRASSFRDDYAPVYEALTELLLTRARRADGAEQRQDLLRRGRATYERFKAAELRDYFRDDCVDAQQARLAAVDRTSPSALVVYPIPLRERTVLLLAWPSGRFEQHEVPVGRERLTAEVTKFRTRLEQAGTRRYLPYAQTLYEWLVAPYVDTLEERGIDTLVFVPQGALLTIPLAALHDGERFLVERFAVAITPGLELTDPQPLDREGLRALLAGLSQSVDGFAALPNVVQELAESQAIVGGRVLLDAAFSQQALRDELATQPIGLLHLATHAEFTSDEGEAFLLSWDGRIPLDALAQDVGRLRFRDNPLELLTLSACETAAGDERAALGFSGVAVKAGARSVLGTLWSVDDPATADLVHRFYRGLLQEKLSRARALQAAQRELIRDFRYSHPAFWAPFQLIGSWL